MNKLVFKQLQARLKLSLTYKNNILVFIKVFSQRLHVELLMQVLFVFNTLKKLKTEFGLSKLTILISH